MHFPSLSSFQSNIFKSMFSEDIYLSIVPIGGYSRRHTNFKVFFESENKEHITIAKKLCMSLGRSHYRSHYRSQNEKKILCDAIDNIAQNISQEGIAYYEIVYDKDDEKNPILYGFSSIRLIRTPFRYFQIVPKSDYSIMKKRINILKVSSIWTITPPNSLGGSSSLRKTLIKLSKINPFGSTPKKDINELVHQKGYNIKQYEKTLRILINKLTKKWGWNKRSMDVKDTTEFYSFYKLITFKYSQALLREHILDELNKLLLRLGVNCEVKIMGIPNSTDLNDLKNDLIEGKATFEDINNKVSLL